MLKLKNVSKLYYNKGTITTGITKINLELNMGEFVVITGESGSGKSTLLNVISGLDSYEEGEMYIDGKETSHYTAKEFEEYRRKYVANIFQNFNLINSYTVYQNVELILLLSGYQKRKIKKRVLEIIEQVGLTKFKNTKVSKLSGGQKQRVAIARAIIKDAPIIVADEPTGNLNTEAASEIIEILKKVAKNKLVVIVTHNLEQVEQYATKIIKMHDGKIIENKEVKQVSENIKPQESKYNKITICNKYRLGLRNTFNIFTKFILLFFVFFFITAALFLEYTGIKSSEHEVNQIGYNINFKDLSENRIIIKKEDKTSFSNQDFKQVKNLSNVDYIVENDLFIDSYIRMYRDEISFSGNIKKLESYKGEVDLGNKPQKDDEIILKTNKNNYFITNTPEKILNKKFKIDDYQDEQAQAEVKIVGIQYSEEINDYDMIFYLSNNMLTKLMSYVNESYSKVKVTFNEKNIDSSISYFNVLPSEKVEKGKVVVNNDLRYQTSNGVMKNRKVVIDVSNIYYQEKLNLKVSNTFTKSTFQKLTGYEKYENYSTAIFINKDQYEAIYNKPSYQASIYIKDIKKIDQIMEELRQLGITPKKASDFRVNENVVYSQIMQIIRITITIVLVFVLFFISYFIIRIILKSRNIYYTTLRMLGATYKTVRRILNIELFINSSLAFLGGMAIIYMVKINILSIPFIEKLIPYMNLPEYILMYVILIVMSTLITRRFTKKLFKDTAINTYNEEV